MSEQSLERDFSSTFAKHLEEPPPDRLFHYTSQSGLIGIVENCKLWATKVQYMNDATEFNLALDMAEQRIRNARKTSTGEVQERLSALFPRRQGIAYVNLFVACFCENGDLLSQWRAYSGRNHGYSLAMSSSDLSKCAARVQFTLGKCIYRPEVQAKILDELIACCLKIADPIECATAFERGLLIIGAFFKHLSFEEEREWRLVSVVKTVRGEPVYFREGTSMIVPYFPIPIGEGRNSAIKAAVVGPCPHPDLAQASVQLLFLGHSLGNEDERKSSFIPDVRMSIVPYRNW